MFVLLGMSALLMGCSEQRDSKGQQTAGPAPAAAREVARPAERPAWLAPPGSERPLDAKQSVQSAGSREEEPRPLKIGVIGPETGEEARYGLRVLDGVTQAAEAFNARGGVAGRPIELVHLDNRSEPAATERAVRELIQQRVVAILAAPTGWSTFAPTRFANDSRTLFMVVGTRRPIRSGPYVFRFALPDELAAEALLRHLTTDWRYTRFALVTSSSYDESLMTSALLKQSVLSHGGEVVVEADTYDAYAGQTAVPEVVQRLAGQTGVQAILYTGGAEEGARLAKALRAAGVRAPLVGGEDLFDAEFLEKGGQDVLDTLLFSSHAPERGPPHLTDRFTALAYDAFMIIARAIEQTGSTVPAKVRETLLTMTEQEGVTGKSGFTAEGVPVKHPFFYRVAQGQGRLTFVPVTPGR
ncbi:MAG: ABC transporter substrate-binding protein [Magnetococcus sp. DMHC-8]